MKVYMQITMDKYELPIIVANSVPELARITGVSANTIRSNMSHAKKYGFKYKFIAVEIEDD